MDRRALVALTFLGVLAAAASPAQQPSRSRVTDLLSAEEQRFAGLNKLSASELDSLNAALVRAFAGLMSVAAGASVSARPSRDDDLALYDSEGKAVAYIEAEDELTIYLWGGQPVAYLDDDSVYGFNGKHLGWYLNGIVYDGRGRVVAAPARAFRGAVSSSGSKGFKRFKPFKGFKQFKPFRPFLGTRWSDLPAAVFFAGGVG